MTPVNFTEREKNLFLRAMDKASAPAKAEKAAEALIFSLRNHGVSGYDILAKLARSEQFSQPQASPPRPAPPPQSAQRRDRQYHIFNPHPDSIFGRLFKQSASKPPQPQSNWAAWSAWADSANSAR